MAPRGLKVTLFHLFFVPIVWAVVLSTRTDYAFSGIESIWMAVDLVAAFYFRIVVTMELCWGVEIVVQRIPSDYGRNLAFHATSFILKFLNVWTTIGALLLLAQRILVELKLSEDSKYWCFLLFILINFYEMFAFFALFFLRIWDINNKHSKIQADSESAKLQAVR